MTSKLKFHNGQWIDEGLETERYVKDEEWRSGDTAWAAAIIGAGVGALLVIAEIYIGFLIG
jgi:hemolysin-activating ACP:hemolysin acyltransferase